MILLHLRVREGRIGHVIRERRDRPGVAFYVVEREVGVAGGGVDEVGVSVQAAVLEGSETVVPEEEEEEEEEKETGYASYDTAYDLV